jgi:hypothetical protein
MRAIPFVLLAAALVTSESAATAGEAKRQCHVPRVPKVGLERPARALGANSVVWQYSSSGFRGQTFARGPQLMHSPQRDPEPASPRGRRLH